MIIAPLTLVIGFVLGLGIGLVFGLGFRSKSVRVVRVIDTVYVPEILAIPYGHGTENHEPTVH